MTARRYDNEWLDGVQRAVNEGELRIRNVAEREGLTYEQLKSALRRRRDTIARYQRTGIVLADASEQLKPPPLPIEVAETAPIQSRRSTVPSAPQPAADKLRALVDFCRHAPRSLEDVCNRLGCSPRDARAALDRAKAQGYALDVSGEQLAWKRPEQTQSEARADWPEPPNGRYLLGVISDLHFGSKYCMRQQLVDFVTEAYSAGVRTMAVPGDVLDGCYRHGQWELTHHGWDDQATDAFETLPRLDGLHYYFIDGNHDQTFWDQTGMLSGQRLAELFAARGRDDLTYLGMRQGRILLRTPSSERPVVVELWHPRPGKSYALSYQLQKRIEGYAPGGKPDVLLSGHWHTFCYLEQRGVHAIACGTFQSGESAFAKSLSGTPSCGGQVLSCEVTESGTLRHVGVQRTSYYLPEGGRDVVMGRVA